MVGKVKKHKWSLADCEIRNIPNARKWPHLQTEHEGIIFSDKTMVKQIWPDKVFARLRSGVLFSVSYSICSATTRHFQFTIKFFCLVVTWEIYKTVKFISTEPEIFSTKDLLGFVSSDLSLLSATGQNSIKTVSFVSLKRVIIWFNKFWFLLENFSSKVPDLASNRLGTCEKYKIEWDYPKRVLFKQKLI